MSKFNEKKKAKVVNKAGGKAYKESYEMQFVSLLLTSFMNDKFYETEKSTIDRMKDLIEKCDKEFCAKAIVYARREFGMRSVTHVAASILAKHISNEEWAKGFFNSVVYRVDDMTEIVSYHLSNNEKISNAMKRGFSVAFSKFDKYQIAKYRGENNKVKLVDVVNLIHPKYSEKVHLNLPILGKVCLLRQAATRIRRYVLGRACYQRIDWDILHFYAT